MNKLLPRWVKKGLELRKKGFFYVDLTFAKIPHSLAEQANSGRLAMK